MTQEVLHLFAHTVAGLLAGIGAGYLSIVIGSNRRH